VADDYAAARAWLTEPPGSATTGKS